MAISTNPEDPNFGLETDTSNPNFGLPVEQHQDQGGVLAGIGSGIVHALNPINLVKGALDIGQPSDISNIIRYGKTLGEIVTGKSPGEAIGENIPELQQQREATFGKLGIKAQAEQLTGIGLQAGLLALPFVHGRIREIAFGKSPPVVPETAPEAVAQETPVTNASETETLNQTGSRGFTTTRPAPTAAETAENLGAQYQDLNRQATDIQSGIDAQNAERQAKFNAANVELGPLTEPPEATQPAPEAFPSLTRSAEDQRRIEQQQVQPPQVRQAISLDELRLMRERGELQLQNEIAQRVTGSTHPAVDERLNQIDDELTTIANRELQTEGGGEIQSAVQDPSTGEILQREPQEVGAPGGERERVEQGQQGQETAETRPEEVKPVEPQPPAATADTGISNQRLTEAYGDNAPVAETGKGPGAWKDEGLSRLDNFQKTGNTDNDPYAVLTKIRQSGSPNLASDVSLLRAEHQRLLEDARNAEGTPEWQAKSQAALNMAEAIKGVAHGPASDVFRALQEYDKPRYDNVTDFDQALRERENRESTPEEKVQFKKVADDVTSTRNGAEKEINGAQKQISKYPRLSFDDAAQTVHDQITELTKDCVL